MTFIPNTDADKKEMLAALRVSSVEELFVDIPADVPRVDPQLPPAVSEMELQKELTGLGRENFSTRELTCFLGAGAYEHFIPAAVPAIISRGEFLTSYTPYQPEASQGNLQATYEFQTTICELCGMEVANASMYDGASALAEAGLMAVRLTRANRVLVAPGVHPAYRATLDTYLSGIGLKSETLAGNGGVVDPAILAATLDDEVACVIVQTPNFLGFIEPMAEIGKILADHPAIFIASVNPLSLGVLAPPGEYRADIAVGDVQPLGLPLAFGGPYAGFFACRREMVHQMPGRIVGATSDAQGRRGYVLTLQAREQHIRRERATSNICSNQALCALAATVYCSLMGADGLRAVAEANLANAHYLAGKLAALPGCAVAGEAPFFNEFPLHLPKPAEEVAAQLLEEDILAGLPLGKYLPERADQLLICATELRTQAEMDDFAATLGEVLR
jgi:glycine dehydrogenase subunit 1